ncbi:MAG: CDP-diacylglycerol--serine O-phosphatidyltransferase [Myxococcales bacterium]|nr:CDP-diacylglycerol--serine O-phosphatidyltransferase [Myxococcales bacterium]
MDPAPEKRRFRRRGRRRSGPPRGLYLLPHLVTTTGLFFGFFAIIQAFAGKPDLAALGIILAGVCDGLDGRLARIAHSSSRFGVEYDSIADTVSFAVAPAMLAFAAGNLEILGRTGWVMAFLFTACAALRLARFNVAASQYRGRFEGLPSPAAACMVASATWFGSFMAELGMPLVIPEAFVAGCMAVLGLLMVTAIPYRSGKEMDLRHSYGTLVFVLFVLALVVVEPSVSLFVIGLVYIASGPVEWMWRRRTGNPLEKLEPASEAGSG